MAMISMGAMDYCRAKQNERREKIEAEDRRIRNENQEAQKKYYEALAQQVVEDIRNRNKNLERFKIDPEGVSNNANIKNISENQKNLSINININIDNDTDISKIQSLINSLQ